MFTQYAPLEDRLRRAAIARGFSSKYLSVKKTAEGRHFVYDDVTGDWLKFDTSGWRVRVIGSGKKGEA